VDRYDHHGRWHDHDRHHHDRHHHDRDDYRSDHYLGDDQLGAPFTQQRKSRWRWRRHA
jgi:hypothetical protein